MLPGSGSLLPYLTVSASDALDPSSDMSKAVFAYMAGCVGTTSTKSIACSVDNRLGVPKESLFLQASFYPILKGFCQIKCVWMWFVDLHSQSWVIRSSVLHEAS